MLRMALVAVALSAMAACRARPSGEPFGGPPLPAGSNCGPERRHKVEAAISSKAEFARFLDTAAIDPWLALDDFRDPASGRLDRGKVAAAAEVRELGGRTIYALDYHPADCSPAQKHTVKVTSDGHVSVYGCCGK